MRLSVGQNRDAEFSIAPVRRCCQLIISLAFGPEESFAVVQGPIFAQASQRQDRHLGGWNEFAVGKGYGNGFSIEVCAPRTTHRFAAIETGNDELIAFAQRGVVSD